MPLGVLVDLALLNCRACVSVMFMFLFFSDCGIGLESGVYVTAIVQGSPAAREGSLTVGDRLIAVSHCRILCNPLLKYICVFFSPLPPHLSLHSSLGLLRLSNPGLVPFQYPHSKPEIRQDLVECVK